VPHLSSLCAVQLRPPCQLLPPPGAACFSTAALPPDMGVSRHVSTSPAPPPATQPELCSAKQKDAVARYSGQLDALVRLFLPLLYHDVHGLYNILELEVVSASIASVSPRHGGQGIELSSLYQLLPDMACLWVL
jgi:hypothetical protein